MKCNRSITLSHREIRQVEKLKFKVLKIITHFEVQIPCEQVLHNHYLRCFCELSC